MPRYDVFLSHASADKPAVERLARKLREEGIEPFLDKWHLVPGDPWHEALEEALDQSRTCAVFLGKTIGPWQNEEMRSALDEQVRHRSYRVIPVLLPGGKQPGDRDLPRFLRRRTWVDFRVGLDDEDAFRRLLAGIRGEAPGPGRGGELHSLLDRYRCMAPAREPFVQRSEYAKVRDALLAGATVGITTAIHGAGGFGKTALAVELCYDPVVRERYPDGILWATMGEEIDAAGRLARMRDLIRWWTEKDPPAFETVSAASAHLRQELAGKRVLLGVDDIWRPEDVTPFQGLGPTAALLLTTRDKQILPGGAVPVHVDAMEIPEAVRMLGAGFSDGTGVDLRSVAKRLGEWPLLLKIVNRQLRELIQQDGLSLEQSIREVNEALDAEGLTVFDREDLESRGQAVAKTVGASLRRLQADEVNRFEQLAIFPEDKDIPLRVLEKLWGSGSFATKKLCGRLHDLSLLLHFDRLAGTIRLHDVIRAYLLKRGENQLPEWNQCFVGAYQPAGGDWPDLSRNEIYLWNHLIHHLLGAGQRDVCRNLLRSFQYLEAKLRATDINGLLADYSFFAEDEELRIVRGALRLSAHVLAKHPAELRGQLWGRLLDRSETGIQGLLETSESSGTSWLKSRSASLARPGGALIRTIDHPGVPTSLAVLPDGRVVSGSDDGTLRVWDLESGQPVHVLEGHYDRVHTLAVLDQRRIISGSGDGTLRIWDMENGSPLQIIDGDSLRIFAVAALDSSRVVYGLSDGTLKIRDIESGQVLRELDGQAFYALAVAALDERRVAAGFSDGKLLEWEWESGRLLHIFHGHSSWVNAVSALDNRRIISCSADSLRVWDAENGQALQILDEHSAEVNTLVVLDARRVVSGSTDWTLRVWDVQNGQTLQILEGHSAEVHAVAVLDGHRVISGSSDRTLRIWEVEDRQSIQELERRSWIHTLAVLDDRRAISSSSDGTLTAWNLANGQAFHALKGRSGWGISLAALDDPWVAVQYDVEWPLLWNPETGQTIEIQEGHSSWAAVVEALERREHFWFLRNTRLGEAKAALDNRRVTVGANDGTLRVQDMVHGNVECLLTLDAPVTTITVIPNSRVILAGDALGRVHFLDFVEPVVPPATSPDFLISYNRADQTWAEWIAWQLEAAGSSTALEAWDFRPGLSFVEKMQGAMSESGRTIAVLSPDYLAASYPFSEWTAALGAALTVRVRDCEIEGLLPSGTLIDLLRLPEGESRERLLAGVQLEWTKPETSSPFPENLKPSFPGGGGDPGYRCMAPAWDPGFFHRNEYAAVRHALRAGATVGITTALDRAGGFGKTALAVELCYDPLVREQYPDGILWIQMHRHLSDDGRLEMVRDVIRWWTNREPPAFETFSKAVKHLVDLLQGKKALLVVDGAWRFEDVFPFRWLTSTAALLITTCDGRILPQETVSIHVNSMEMPEAIRLLDAGLPGGADVDLKVLAARLGGWPLLLRIVNRQVRAWVRQGLDLGEAIRRFERALEVQGSSHAATVVVETILDGFPEEEQERITQLAIFPEDLDVPLSILERFWQLDAFEARELSSRLHALSLLRDPDARAGTIRLQDVVRTDLLKRGENRLATWHRHLLDSHRPANGRWQELPRKEIYLWRHLFYHLTGAGQDELCRELLFDFQYLRSKLEATDVHALLADYSSFVEGDEELRILRDALRLSAHVLIGNPAQLREQLWGRLLQRQEPGIRGLLESEGSSTPRLRPRKATLTRPSSALIRTIDHSEEPAALAALPNGRVASLSINGTLRVWDVGSGRVLQTFQGHYSDGAVVVLDSRRLVSVSYKTLWVLDVESGETLQVLEGHSSQISSVAVLDSRRVIYGSSDGTLRVWDVESGQTLQTLEGHSGRVDAVAVLDSRRVVSGSEDRTLRVWDMESGQVLRTLEGHSDRVGSVAVLDSHRVVSHSDDRTLRVWDVEGGQTLWIFSGHPKGGIAPAVLDGRWVVVPGFGDWTLQVVDVEGGQSHQTLEGHSDRIKAVVILDSRLLVSASNDGTLRVWNLEGGQTLGRHSDRVSSVAILESSQVVSGSADQRLAVWDVESGEVFRSLSAHSVWLRVVAALDGRRVVSGSDDGTLYVWNVESGGQPLQTFKGHSYRWPRVEAAFAVAVLDNRRVVSSFGGQRLYVWDVESGKTLQTLEGHSKVVGAVAVLDSRRVISGSYDGTLRVWDVENGQTLQVLKEPFSGVSAVSVLDGRRVIAGSNDGTLRVWDVEGGQSLQILEGHSAVVNAVAVLVRHRVVSGSDDRTLRVWNVESGKTECLFTLDASVTDVAVIPDRRIIVAGDASGRVHFFDFVEGKVPRARRRPTPG